jgi:uncharacterized membrane protein
LAAVAGAVAAAAVGAVAAEGGSPLVAVGSVAAARVVDGNMKPKEFLDKLDDDKVTATIAEAERKSSGEIRVFVSNEKPSDTLAAAAAQFLKLGMEKTRERNGVLIFFAPKLQQVAVVGDQGIDARCGLDFWQRITAEITAHLKAGEFTEAVVDAVTHVGDALAKHFPRSPDDRNELPNQIARD